MVITGTRALMATYISTTQDGVVSRRSLSKTTCAETRSATRDCTTSSSPRDTLRLSLRESSAFSTRA
eukprot:4467602-Prymnesium_polylepis.1